jgi:hypothetical protein
MTAFTDNLYEKWLEMSLYGTPLVNNPGKFTEIQQFLNLNGITPTLTGFPTAFVLGTGQATNADTTNTYDAGNTDVRSTPLLVRIVTTIGATPTCTYTINGSVDNSSFSPLSYADINTLGTVTAAAFIITTATTTVKVIPPGQRFRYLKVTYSLNTNVTNSADLLKLG